MPAVNPTRRDALLLVVLLFVQLLLMGASVRGEGGITRLESFLMRVTRPVTGAAGAVGGFVRRSADSAVSLWNAREENARLRDELARVHEDAAARLRAEHENLRLRRLLAMREQLAPQSVGASVVAASLTDQEKVIVVDRGTEDGVHADLPVVAWGGAVGRVVSAGPHLARVRLVTDPSGGVAGVIQRTRVAGMILGKGEDDVVDMRYVPSLSDVMLGDRVVTSGLDGVFPRGIGIGRVVYVGEGSGISKTVWLRPEVDFARLEDVLVLLEPVGRSLLDAPAGRDGR